MQSSSIHQIHVLLEGRGVSVVPDSSLYSDSSGEWSEAEHHAPLSNTRSQVAAWEGQPGWVRIDNWPYHEVCVIQEGRVAVEDTAGLRREFGSGEAFVIPAGFSGIWHTLEPARKIFVGIVPDTKHKP
ncbi:cupin domain-containing protein [Paenarthrobacter nitroguajacolicus]|uniref:cupin domain-containing protein n=1 Tax=Paenarthrobacter nitroguajacolicus TaxID=211146 RepID=UPI00285C8565|nr:cupin domain-containing protein [Paenarthrobacter nitroguajacolicus]MDR6636979.1 putative cupin superfamily protein [Paenarthrobacter nitroguajacolicus]